jgi:hypothetical protein
MRPILAMGSDPVATTAPPRRRYGTTAVLKAAVDTIPRRPSMELFGTIHTPKGFTPLLRPEGPFYGSGT